MHIFSLETKCLVGKKPLKEDTWLLLQLKGPGTWSSSSGKVAAAQCSLLARRKHDELDLFPQQKTRISNLWENLSVELRRIFASFRQNIRGQPRMDDFSSLTFADRNLAASMNLPRSVNVVRRKLSGGGKWIPAMVTSNQNEISQRSSISHERCFQVASFYFVCLIIINLIFQFQNWFYIEREWLIPYCYAIFSLSLWLPMRLWCMSHSRGDMICLFYYSQGILT